jgi:hypothetical protein
MLGAPGQSAQPTAPAKRRGLSRSGFAATAVPNALPMLNDSNAPRAPVACDPCALEPTQRAAMGQTPAGRGSASSSASGADA